MMTSSQGGGILTSREKKHCAKSYEYLNMALESIQRDTMWMAEARSDSATGEPGPESCGVWFRNSGIRCLTAPKNSKLGLG
jgi:hypothetical protein